MVKEAVDDTAGAAQLVSRQVSVLRGVREKAQWRVRARL